jgi:type IV pilus assembly protein PilM
VTSQQGEVLQLSDVKDYISQVRDQTFGLLNLKINSQLEVVGLDIGSKYVKLLKINRAENPYRIEKFAIIPAPVAIGSVSNDPAQDLTILAAAIKDMFTQAGISNTEVALAIPRSIAILKNITIDSRLSPEDIESRAWIEANHHFPDLIGEIYLDFFVSEPLAEDNTHMELTLVACRKSQIQPYLDVLRLAGLQVKIVDVDCYALERALPLTIHSTTNDEVLALLSLNTSTSNLIVVQSNKLIYAHDQGYDGQRLISQTSAYLQSKSENANIPPTELLQDEAYQEILKNNLISHLHHIMHFFSTSRPHLSIKKLILAGDCATVPCMVPFIKQEIGIETEAPNLLSHLVLAPEIDSAKFNEHSSRLVLCCGLALSHLEY